MPALSTVTKLTHHHMGEEDSACVVQLDTTVHTTTPVAAEVTTSEAVPCPGPPPLSADRPLELPQTPPPPAVDVKYAVRRVVAAILAVNALVLGPAVAVYATHLPGATALLAIAYSLGLRHALDADHLAAIDNVTRRMVEEGRTPVTVGLFFSLGHSTVVVIATMLVAALSAAAQRKFDQYKTMSDTIGGSISASFLLLVGIINCVSLLLAARHLRRMHAAGPDASCPLKWDSMLAGGGFFSRTLGNRFFKVIDQPHKMYFVGLLFGLGFDTATEILLLAIAALQGASGVSPWLILFLACAFTCGMCLVDTVDGILMLGVYGWSNISPAQKVAYHVACNAMSCVFAFTIATLQILGVCQAKYDLQGPFWDFIVQATSNAIFGYIGCGMLFLFLVGWATSLLVHHRARKGKDMLEQSV